MMQERIIRSVKCATAMQSHSVTIAQTIDTEVLFLSGIEALILIHDFKLRPIILCLSLEQRRQEGLVMANNETHSLSLSLSLINR